MMRLIQSLFFCRHPRKTFPRARGKFIDESVTEHYVVCLDCGKEFPYDFKNMRAKAA